MSFGQSVSNMFFFSSFIEYVELGADETQFAGSVTFSFPLGEIGS